MKRAWCWLAHWARSAYVGAGFYWRCDTCDQDWTSKRGTGRFS